MTIAEKKAHPREYSAWVQIKTRCYNPKYHAAHRYVMIEVCDRWFSFRAFYSDMGDCPPGMTLERVNNKLGYEPGNCIWASRRVQGRNSDHTKLTFDDAVEVHVRLLMGQKQQDIADHFKIAQTNVSSIKRQRSWPDAKAMAIKLYNKYKGKSP